MRARIGAARRIAIRPHLGWPNALLNDYPQANLGMVVASQGTANFYDGRGGGDEISRYDGAKLDLYGAGASEDSYAMHVTGATYGNIFSSNMAHKAHYANSTQWTKLARGDSSVTKSYFQYGNVAIGTTSTNAKLEVAGTVIP